MQPLTLHWIALPASNAAIPTLRIWSGSLLLVVNLMMDEVQFAGLTPRSMYTDASLYPANTLTGTSAVVNLAEAVAATVSRARVARQSFFLREMSCGLREN